MTQLEKSWRKYPINKTKNLKEKVKIQIAVSIIFKGWKIT